MRSIALGCLALTIATSSVEATERDGLCAPLAAFANAAPSGKSLSVKFRGDWADMQWSCENDDRAAGLAKPDLSGPGSTFCLQLMERASKEFGAENLWRVLSCVPQSPAPALHGVLADRIAGKLLLTKLQGVDEDVVVDLEFALGHGEQWMRITAERLDEAESDSG